MESSTYKVRCQKIKGNWVTYTLFLGIGLLFVNRYAGLLLLVINIIFTVIYKNNNDNKSAVAFNLGVKEAMAGDAKSAKNYLSEAITFNPLNREAHIFLGCLLFDEKDYKNALEYLKSGHAEEQKDPSLVFAMGVCNYNVDNFDKAIDYLESISYEGNEKLEKVRLFTLGRAFAENSRFEKGYEILHDLDFPEEEMGEEEYIDYCYYRGVCSFHLDYDEEADKYFNIVREKDSDYKYINLYTK